MKKKIVLFDGLPVSIAEDGKEWSVNYINPGCYTIKGKYQGNTFNSSVFRNGNKFNVNINGASYVVEPSQEDYLNDREIRNSDQSKVFSPMTGIILDILVNEGEEVHTGQLLLRIESMKLVLTVNSSNKGIIKDIRVKKGQKVSAGDFIMEIKE